MDTGMDIMRTIIALGVVVLLMLILSKLAQKLPRFQRMIGEQGAERIKVKSSALLDARHRLVIVEIDGTEKRFYSRLKRLQRLSYKNDDLMGTRCKTFITGFNAHGDMAVFPCRGFGTKCEYRSWR